MIVLIKIIRGIIMNPIKQDTKYEIIQSKLKIDCEKCSGLCCVALFCAKTDGFPEKKTQVFHVNI